MHNRPGIPFHGDFASADVTTATEIPIYEAGSLTLRTLEPQEYLEIDDATLVIESAGQADLFMSDDGNIENGERVISGPFSSGGGEQKSLQQPYVGSKGRTLRVQTAIAGNVRVTVQGRIRNQQREGRPNWKEAVNGD